MSTEEVLKRCRRNHNVTFHRTVETVDIVLKSKTFRIEVFEAAGRFGYSLFEFRDLEQEGATVLHLSSYSKPEYTNQDGALMAALQSLGYRS